MSRKLLLFGFEEPHHSARRGRRRPFGAEVVPVARQDYNKPLAVLAGLDDDPGTVLPFNGGPLGGRMVVLCGLEDQVDCLLPALRQGGSGGLPEGGADAPQPDLDRCEALSGAAAGAPGHERAVRRCGSISACLLGARCRYDGVSKLQPWISDLAERHILVPVCPERLGVCPHPVRRRSGGETR